MSLETAPVLSTPDTRLLEATDPVVARETTSSGSPRLSDDELCITYDIERTLQEIRRERYKRIALQFPDEMLPDAPRVFQLLSRGVQEGGGRSEDRNNTAENGSGEGDAGDAAAAELVRSADRLDVSDRDGPAQFYILADTSYGTCCVDEVAAEHVNADVVVHYGRSCLSPTARLPVIYVFTHRELALDPLVAAFQSTYPDRGTMVVLAADAPYADHIPAVHARLVQDGYTHVFATELVHDPASAIPNRTVPQSVREKPESLADWQLFHIAEPPTALLLTLASRVAAIHIYPTDSSGSVVSASAAATLRRRYAILTRLSTAPVFGILVNTLSVKNYLHIVDHVRERIAAAGKKSYLFVVGKLNAAKVANFSEVGGWIVIGCWESSLVDSKDFWKPVITPFELEMALQSDDERVWTGAWQSDFQSVLDSKNPGPPPTAANGETTTTTTTTTNDDNDDDFESAPPEFDLRTGRYVSNSRPMRDPAPRATGASALTRRARGDLALVAGTLSPGAEFLHTQRTWTGLGSDVQYEEDRDSTLVVEGRKGIARGYTVGDSDRH
ncbi:hypothetical protein ASPZODRAFT_131790 [Penicilliopsis zonata CBS 506.65]|uniref:2-(3-amino-3-carboxypropyl)histidine synthase subunit 2 n=1 Tax=Penicilliopsis zonata CBS 506.65 TaxID=1073090 RepID=A0A1L9SIB8_9EURO|nr:hypothetical protein ASPZODRAFT_131790 [Penicilliopsis zonata CBS 506.65]OJJ46887.1 hypothetical protein ASPZODRAFT_131790 [Penicilliopsis zonata CBS 506.65]